MKELIKACKDLLKIMDKSAGDYYCPWIKEKRNLEQLINEKEKQINIRRESNDRPN